MTHDRATSNKTTTSSSSSSSMPPLKWFHLYGDFISKNANAVSQIESGLRSLTYIIPGRYRESDIASEAVHSTVQLLALYHDHLLSTALSALPPSRRPTPTPHTRYTKHWTSRSPLYHRTAILLQTITYTELLWEMAAKRKGERVRWHVVVFLEVVKAACRLLLLRVTGSRPLVGVPLPMREDVAVLENEGTKAEGEDMGDVEAKEQDAEKPWTMPRTGMALPSLPGAGDISSYLLSHVLTPDDIKPPTALLRQLSSSRGTLEEVLYILRPVIYAYALARCHLDESRDRRKEWWPWLLGFGLEFAARRLMKQDLENRVAGGLRGCTVLEKEEITRRGWAMGWWMMRGAFYENITKGWVHGVTNKMRDKPLLSLVGTILEDYEFLWDQYYFPTATL